MNAKHTFRIVKASFLLIFMTLMTLVNAQVSPYGISPDWCMGVGGRWTFANGNFPTSTVGTIGSRLTNTSNGPEQSTSVCFRNGSVAIYTNTIKVHNGGNSTGWADNIRDLAAVATDNTCAGSSTGGAVSFPNPANDAANNSFYLVLSNDYTGGGLGCPDRGFNYYTFNGTGTTVAYNAGPDNLISGATGANRPSEAMAACADGTGGYWVLGHVSSAVNTFMVWHFTAGGVSARTNYTVGANVNDVSGTQSCMKVSPCQNKVAYSTGTWLVVHSFDRTTGQIGPELRRMNPMLHGSGVEFSPDGNRVFYSGQGTAVSYVDIATGTTGTVAGSSSWGMQLGPDGRIYTSGTQGATTIGYISDPNGTPTYTAVPMVAGTNVYRGLANEVWLNPQKSAITASGACSMTFGIDFKNYFNTQVAIDVSTIQWDFDTDGTIDATGVAAPTWDYAAHGGTGDYTVTVTFKDDYCDQDWSATLDVHASCPMPVEWLEVSADVVGDGIDINWATASEENTSYFVVQRSLNGQDFTDIGNVAAAGNSNTIRNYNLRDQNPYTGASYYRIVQYDIDGKSTASRIVAVNLSSISLKVYPNPTDGQFELELSGAGQAELTVTDVLGRVVYTGSLQGDYVNTRFGDDLGKGTYVLTVVTPTKTLHEKLVKE